MKMNKENARNIKSIALIGSVYVISVIAFVVAYNHPNVFTF